MLHGTVKVEKGGEKVSMFEEVLGFWASAVLRGMVGLGCAREWVERGLGSAREGTSVPGMAEGRQKVKEESANSEAQSPCGVGEIGGRLRLAESMTSEFTQANTP